MRLLMTQIRVAANFESECTCPYDQTERKRLQIHQGHIQNGDFSEDLSPEVKSIKITEVCCQNTKIN